MLNHGLKKTKTVPGSVLKRGPAKPRIWATPTSPVDQVQLKAGPAQGLGRQAQVKPELPKLQPYVADY